MQKTGRRTQALTNNSKEVGEWRNKNERWEDTKQEANAMERGGVASPSIAIKDCFGKASMFRATVPQTYKPSINDKFQHLCEWFFVMERQKNIFSNNKSCAKSCARTICVLNRAKSCARSCAKPRSCTFFRKSETNWMASRSGCRQSQV